MGIDTSAIRQYGRLTGQGSGTAWKAAGTETYENRVLSLPPIYGESPRQEFGPASNTGGTKRCVDQDHGSPPTLTRGSGGVPFEPHKLATPVRLWPAQPNTDDYASGQSSGAVNAAPKGFPGSNPWVIHQFAGLVDWLNGGAPLR